jgi:two-component system OmpR family sensor kinase
VKSTSIFVQVLGLTTLVLVVALAVGAMLTQALPAPDRGRINVLEMAWALEQKPSSVIDTASSTKPPSGQRSEIVERALALAMGKPLSEVRAVWNDLPRAVESHGHNVLLIDGRDVLVSGDTGGFSTTYNEHDRLAPQTFVPLFTAAVRSSDGNWLVGTPHDPALAAWRIRILLSFALAAILLAGPVWWISRWIARPIEALAVAAERTRLASTAPFPVSGPREVRTAALAINAMHARLVAQAQDQLRMVTALAHDLRTPLTALRLRAEEAPPELAGRLTPDLKRMGTMIEDCLTLVSEGARPVSLREVRLDEFIDVCIGARGADGITATLERPVVVNTDAARLRRAVDNLLDNAIRYGQVARIHMFVVEGWVRLQITDDGPGLPADQVERLMKPFETMDPARSRDLGGVGLGLSIVADIARELDLRFTLTNIPSGLMAQLDIPLSRATDR